MAEKTLISWADSSVNFWFGCRRVSAGCDNCYIADSLPFKFNRMKHGSDRHKSNSAVKNALRYNKLPWICDECGTAHAIQGDLRCGHGESQTSKGCECRTYHRRRIFSLSLGDWLDEEVPIEWLSEMLDTIRQCDQVTWILCTKRPENWEQQIRRVEFCAAKKQNIDLSVWTTKWLLGHAPTNIILLASVENQAMADKRIPELLRIPAACRGLSLEPLLGAVTIPAIATHCPRDHNRDGDCDRHPSGCPKISWYIIGGESGPNARPCNVDWIRWLVAQGRTAGVTTFCKQLGSNSVSGRSEAVGKLCGLTGVKHLMRDKKGGDPDEWPIDLRIQDWPQNF